jgi:hypothetical protein
MIGASLMVSGCGETTNRWDGIALDRFEADPIFELVPNGATQAYDALSIGSPESRDFGSDNARAVLWEHATEPADAIARQYVDALLEQGWSELDVECTGDGTGNAVYIVNGRRSVDGYVDIVRVVTSDEGPDRKGGVVVSTPFHASPQPTKPDPSTPPDTACLDALSM